MNNSFWRLLLAALWFVVGLATSFPLSADSLPEGVAVTIEPAQASYSRDDRVLVKLTYTNKSDQTVRLLKWTTGLEGRIDEDVLSIWFNDQEVAYHGRHYKRGPATAENYVVLAPSQSVSATIDLQLSYGVALAGEYRLMWRANFAAAISSTSNLDRHEIIAEQGVKLLLEQNIALPEFSRPSRLPAQFVGCSGERPSQITSALAVAESYARVARDDLSATPTDLRPEARRYREWFGNYDPSRWSKVQDNFNRIYSTVSGRTLLFDCTCTEPYYAYVYPSQPYNIYLCNAFWNAPTSGTDSKAGTIIHEVSHFTAVTDTDDVTYGQSACRDLARNEPSNAIRNADSHEYFAENTPALSMPSGSDAPPSPEEPDPPPPPPEPEPVIPSFLVAVITLLFGE